jgi:hypothetical protein
MQIRKEELMADFDLNIATNDSASSCESLVPDVRAGLSPAQMVDAQLWALLRERFRPVSQQRTPQACPEYPSSLGTRGISDIGNWRST